MRQLMGLDLGHGRVVEMGPTRAVRVHNVQVQEKLDLIAAR